MTRVLLTAKQQLDRVAEARRESIMRMNPIAIDPIRLRYKPHLRMHISKPQRVDMSPESPRRSVCVEWFRPLPDGRVRVEVLCAFWDFVPMNGWQIVRDITSPDEGSKRARLFGRGFLPWRFDQ